MYILCVYIYIYIYILYIIIIITIITESLSQTRCQAPGVEVLRIEAVSIRHIEACRYRQDRIETYPVHDAPCACCGSVMSWLLNVCCKMHYRMCDAGVCEQHSF